MKVASFTVDCLVSLPTGNYALYSASNGKRIWTRDIGYNPKDVVELYYDESGPKKVIINGAEQGGGYLGGKRIE